MKKLTYKCSVKRNSYLNIDAVQVYRFENIAYDDDERKRKGIEQLILYTLLKAINERHAKVLAEITRCMSILMNIIALIGGMISLNVFAKLTAFIYIY
jgi:hypothetical protein